MKESPAEAEQAIFRSMARDMLQVQAANCEKTGAQRITRTMYAKTVAGITNASLIIDRVLPAELAVAHFPSRRPASRCDAPFKRQRNCSNRPHSGYAGRVPSAWRFQAVAVHDLLLANYPTSLVRNARQFFELAMTSMGDRETLLARLAERLSVPESRRIATKLKASLKLCPSLALQRFWSGCAFLWGDSPVHFALQPTAPDRTHPGRITQKPRCAAPGVCAEGSPPPTFGFAWPFNAMSTRNERRSRTRP